MSQSVDFIRDFRDAQRIRALARQIQKEIRHPLRVMEICGGHTHTIMRFGLPQVLRRAYPYHHAVWLTPGSASGSGVYSRAGMPGVHYAQGAH